MEARAMTVAYVLLGSNSDPMRNLQRAVALLREEGDLLAVSSVYRTTAQREAAGGADYLNMVAALQTTLTAADFKVNLLRQIENALGRERGTPNIAIDLDIMLWGDTALDYSDGLKTWHAPHPDLLRYGYAALPLAEIAPDVIHPETGQRLRAIVERLRDDTIVWIGALAD
jgi:2-amino-4-hydroxy-6-hydroxymethyldihydropteridine diphosphokinase